MYCPSCGIENGDGAKFCRKCGSNISLVPQALSGTLPDAGQPDPETVNLYSGKIESGVKKSLMGLGFVIISVAMALGRQHEWPLMLIPAAVFLGRGVSQILALRYAGLLILPRAAKSSPTEAVSHPGQRLLGEPLPPSVTEHTTRNMSQGARERREF